MESYLQSRIFQDVHPDSPIGILRDKVSGLVASIIDRTLGPTWDFYIDKESRGPNLTFGASVIIYDEKLYPIDSKSNDHDRNTNAIKNFYRDRKRIKSNLESSLFPTVNENDLLQVHIDSREYQIEGVEVSKLEPYIVAVCSGYEDEYGRCTEHGEFRLFADFTITIRILNLKKNI